MTDPRPSIFALLAPIDLGPLVERSIRREREQIDAFLAEVGATPETHHLVVYPAPDDTPDDPFDMGPRPIRYLDYVYVAVPIAECPPGLAEYPTRDEACVRWPHRRISRDGVVRDAADGR